MATNYEKEIIRKAQQDLMPDERDKGLQLEDRDVRSASSFKAEIHFVGQIVGGTFFDQGSDGLICEVQLQAGDHWKMFGPEILNQSQTSYADPGDMVIWGHPFDLHFGSDSIFGWPRLDIRVWRLDVYGKVDIGKVRIKEIVANGVINLPNKAGFFELECPTWRPIGNWKEEAYQFFLSCPPKLNDKGSISQNAKDRMVLETQSSGSVHIQVEVLTKNYKDLDISH